MRKNLLFLFIVASTSVAAQNTDGKNEVKVNLSAVAFKGLGLQYERQIGKRTTIALGYAAIPTSSLPYKSYIKKQIYIPSADIAGFRLSTSIFTPEVRYYFGKQGAFHGFYISPYGRFSSYKLSGPIIYTNANNQAQRATFNGKLHSNTAGLLFGSAWKISRRFYIDCWFAGISYGHESGNFKESVQLSPADQNSLRKTLNSISLSGINLTSEVNNNGAFIKTSGAILGFRAVGINICFRF